MSSTTGRRCPLLKTYCLHNSFKREITITTTIRTTTIPITIPTTTIPTTDNRPNPHRAHSTRTTTRTRDTASYSIGRCRQYNSTQGRRYRTYSILKSFISSLSRSIRWWLLVGLCFIIATVIVIWERWTGSIWILIWIRGTSIKSNRF